MNLVINEIVKQVKKKSFIVLLSIVVALSVLFPLVSHIQSKGGNGDSYINYMVGYYEGYSYDEDKYTKEVHKEISDTYLKYLKEAKSQNIVMDDIMYQYIELNTLESLKLNFVTRLSNGEDYKRLFKATSNYLYDEQDHVDTLPVYDSKSKSELLEEKEVLSKKILSQEKAFKNKDVKLVLDSKIKEYNDELESEKVLVKEAEATKDPKKYTNAKKVYDQKQEKINSQKEVFEYLLKNNITKASDFRIEAANEIAAAYDEMVYSFDFTSEKDYRKESPKLSYTRYKENVKKINIENEGKVKKLWYSIKENKNYQGEEAKSLVKDSIFVIELVTILVAIVAGSIVSSEFNKGSVRMLLISPNKRWKILLSKLVATIVIALILALCCYAVLYISSGIMAGFKDLLIPELIVKNGEIIETGFITNMLPLLALAVVPVLFTAIFAFSLSTVTNNTAVSVAVTIAAVMGYSIATFIFIQIKLPITDLLPTSYMNIRDMLDVSSLTSIESELGLELGVKKGLIVLAVYSAIFYLISNLVFIRKDIKN